jgi:cell division protein FtsB
MDTKRLTSTLRHSFNYLWLIAVAGYLVVSAGQAMLRNYNSQQQISTLQQKLSELNLEKQRLEALLVYYKTDTYKEKALRENLLLVRPEERVYALPESGNVRSLEDEVLQPAEKQVAQRSLENAEPSWRQWIDYLF